MILNLMALRHSAFYSPYLMMMAGGHLRGAGFEVNYSLQTPTRQVRQSLLDGSCHVSQSAVAASFASLESHQPDSIRHFAQINNRDGFFIATRNKTRNFQWQDLQGKRLLADHFFQPLAMLKYALEKQRIDWHSIDIIDAGDVNQIEQAFRDGLADYVHMQGPTPQQLQSEGLAWVCASVGEVIGPVAFSSLCATEDWLATEAANTFFQLYQRSLQQCQQEKASDIARQLQDYGFLNEIHSEVLVTTIECYQQLGCWNHSGEIAETEYNTLLDVFEYSQLISERYAPERLIVSL